VVAANRAVANQVVANPAVVNRVVNRVVNPAAANRVAHRVVVHRATAVPEALVVATAVARSAAFRLSKCLARPGCQVVARVATVPLGHKAMARAKVTATVMETAAATAATLVRYRAVSAAWARMANVWAAAQQRPQVKQKPAVAAAPKVALKDSLPAPKAGPAARTAVLPEQVAPEARVNFLRKAQRNGLNESVVNSMNRSVDLMKYCSKSSAKLLLPDAIRKDSVEVRVPAVASVWVNNRLDLVVVYR
jgi:hypothetical protein